MRVLPPVLVLLASPIALAGVCSDFCLEAGRTDWVECREDATATFAFDRQLCLDRDPACVQACAAREDDCGDATGLGAALDSCLGQEQIVAINEPVRTAATTRTTRRSKYGSTSGWPSR